MSARPGTWLFRLTLVVAAPLVFLLVLEGGLRLGGFGRDPRFFIPDEQPGYFRSNPRFTELFFPASFALKPVNFRLPKQKPAGAVRVFVLGESAAMGIPEPAFGLAPQLRAQLRAIAPAKTFEVYNLGVTAINSHVIRPLLLEALEFRPDLLVIYMGNNEVVGPYGSAGGAGGGPPPLTLIRAGIWVRGTRTGQLIERAIGFAARRGNGFRAWRGMETFADKTVAADSPVLARIRQHFGENLSAMLAAADSAGVKVVLSTVAVNARDAAPFVAQEKPGLNPAQRTAVEEAWQDARRRFALEDFAGALAAAERGLTIDRDRADLHYLLARCADSLGYEGIAAEHYAAAVDADALRFRADDFINQAIRTAARARAGGGRVMLVDAATQLVPGPLPPDRESFFEHVHLNWDGNFRLARLLAAPAADALFGPADRPRPWLEEPAMALAVGYTAAGRLSMLQAMDRLTARPPFTGQFSFARDRAALAQELKQTSEAVLAPGELRRFTGQLGAAAERDPDNDALLGQAVLTALQAGDATRALALADRLAATQPFSAEQAATRALILRQLKRGAEAEPGLQRAVAEEPYYFQAYGLLAQLWAENGRTAEAKAFLDSALQRMPDSRVLRLTQAQLLAHASEDAAAELAWREVLRTTPDDEAALAPLLQRLAGRREWTEALALMEAAHRANPRSWANNQRLADYYRSQRDAGKFAATMADWVESGPVPAARLREWALALRVTGQGAAAKDVLIRARLAARAEGATELVTEIERELVQ